MGYVETFRNSLAVDILEWTGIVTVPSNFMPQKRHSINSSTDLSESSQLTTPSMVVEKELEEEKSIKSVNSSGNTVSTSDGNHRTDVLPVQLADAVRIEMANDDIERAISRSSHRNIADIVEQDLYDPFLVDWNGEDDPEKPTNWSKTKKTLMCIQVMFYTFVTYMGSSIYTPGQPQIQEQFHVGHVAATLTLSLFILGYSLGPMIFSPLSEVSTIGRNHIYMITLFLFWILQIGIALTPTFGGLLTLRLITGFFSSPSIATGGATLGDFVSQEFLPMFIGLWAVGGFMAPSIAPILGAAMVEANNWRWIFWLILWIDAFIWLFMIFFFTESQHNNILHRRANRIRNETGDNRYYTKHEREESRIEWKAYIKEIIFRPFIIIAQEPGVLALDMYLALIYGTYYLFFEAFPIVYTRIYDFGPVLLGLTYTGFAIGCILGYIIFLSFLKTQIVPRFMNNTFTLERYLYLSIWVCFLTPASLFIFGWTAGKHWVLPIIAEIIYAAAAFNIVQSLFAYLSLNYPRYLASIFAGNAFMRSSFAVAFPLFGEALYNKLAIPNYPVGWGSSLLGFISLAMTLIPFVLIHFGPRLRGHSKYAN